MTYAAKIFTPVLIAVTCQLLMACSPATYEVVGTGPVLPTPTPPPPTSVSPAPPALGQIQEIVLAFNNTQEAQGLEAITPGLDCQLFTVPINTTSIATSILTPVGGFLNVSGFNQPNCSGCGLNVLPEALQSVYTTYFELQCTGYLVSTTDAWHTLALPSDDGAIVSVGGQQVVNNDGLHSVSTATSAVFLSTGVHPVEIDYLQGPGLMALQLFEDGSIIDPALFYH
jgi:hypothetical protein